MLLEKIFLKKTFFEWKNKTKKISYEKCHLMILTLKQLFSSRKQFFFQKIILVKQNLYYDSIIKNILPLMQTHSLFSIKLKENLMIAFQRIKYYSKDILLFSLY